VNLAVAASVFPLIFLGELPDKTMFASLVLSSRGRPGAVWVGAAAAFVIHVAIAVSAGTAAVLLLPRRGLEAVVAALFLAGAVLMLREMRREQRRGSGDGAAGQRPGPRRASPGQPVPGAPRVAATAFAVIFVAEWGDLTQVLIANLSAHYRAPLSVGVGALLGLWAATALAVAGGRWLGRVLSAVALRAAAVTALAGFAAYAAWTALA
jgi:putative Ca2+/H+ antiporter (TMEM165/GDT1 family)